MRRSQLSLVTAAIVLVGAVIFLSLGQAVPGLLWVAISIGWLLTAIVQRTKSDADEPSPRNRLQRRVSRLLRIWS
jgi:hypothetical protein